MGRPRGGVRPTREHPAGGSVPFYGMLIVAVLFGLVLLRWVVLAVGVFLLLPRVRECPACFRSTIAVRRPWLRRLLPWLEWRWCLSCGWEGPSRTGGRSPVPRRAEGTGGPDAGDARPGSSPPRRDRA